MPEIVEEEAKVVRYIYRLCLEGKTPHNIAKLLTEEGIPTPSGKTRWQQTTVESILTNAKERRDAVTAEIAKRNSRKEQIEDFLRTMEKAKTLVTDFDEGMWNAVIESLTVYSKERLVFTFKSGTQVEWSIK